MAQYQVVTKRFVSSNGKIIAEAKSQATTLGTNDSQVSQSVSIYIHENGTVSSKSVSINTCAKID
jgi:hypothetical protein